MQQILRNAVLIVSAMIGGGIVLLILITAASSLSVYASIPADFLPKDRAEILLMYPKQEDIALWSQRYPVIDELPSGTFIAIAVIHGEDGNDTAVAFFDETAEGTPIGPYRIAVTDDNILKDISATDQPLGTTSEYRAFLKHLPKHTTWAYVSALPWAYTYHDNVLQLMRYAPERPVHTLPASVPYVQNSFVMVSMAHAKDVWMTLQSVLPEQQSIIVESVLRSLVSFMGDEISFSYDIVPLLAEPTVLQYTESDGDMSMLLSGSAENTKTLNEFIERLHESFAQNLPTSRVTKRILDKRFSSVDLRHDPSLIQTELGEKNHWALLSTHQPGNNDGLFSAVHGTNYVIATQESVLLDALTQESAISQIAEVQNGIVTSAGVLDIEKVATALQTVFPQVSTMLRATGNGTLSWVSFWSAGVESFMITTPENSFKLLDSLL